MPFITEDVWQRLGAGESIMVAAWPERHREHRDERSERRFRFAQELVSEIRRFRKAHGLKDSAKLLVLVHASPAQRSVIEPMQAEMEQLAGLSRLELLDEPRDPSGSAVLDVDGAHLMIPLAGVLDRDAERTRLNRRIDAVEHEASRVESKLANESFLTKAPAAVVEKERVKLDSLKQEAATLAAQLAELG
jgi:valyl-tRNA synthetase